VDRPLVDVVGDSFWHRFRNFPDVVFSDDLKSMRRLVSACLLVGFSIPFGEMACAQTKPEFEIASIKPSSTNGGPVGLFTYPGGKVVVKQYTVRMLLHEAFDIDADHISNGPGWIDDDRYDITAIPPTASKSSQLNPSSPKTAPNEE
jgi:Protein of unknown function (DUF3738)